jgi:hypothetical protein
VLFEDEPYFPADFPNAKPAVEFRRLGIENSLRIPQYPSGFFARYCWRDHALRLEIQLKPRRYILAGPLPVDFP